MGARLAIQLLYIVSACIEQIAVVCLLIARSEATKDQDVLVGDLIQAAALETYPVCVLFYAQVERLPVLPPLDVILLDQIGPLPAIEASDNVQSLIVKGYGCVEISARIKTGDLRPCVTANIVDLALVHRFTRQ